ncbi:MAG: hypothetical protein AAGA08_16945 [Pseudomonadota bacterium]
MTDTEKKLHDLRGYLEDWWHDDNHLKALFDPVPLWDGKSHMEMIVEGKLDEVLHIFQAADQGAFL